MISGRIFHSASWIVQEIASQIRMTIGGAGTPDRHYCAAASPTSCFLVICSFDLGRLLLDELDQVVDDVGVLQSVVGGR